MSHNVFIKFVYWATMKKCIICHLIIVNNLLISLFMEVFQTCWENIDKSKPSLLFIAGFYYCLFLGGMFQHQDFGCGFKYHCSRLECPVCRKIWSAGAWLLLSECASGWPLPTSDSRGVTTRYQIQPAPQWATQRILLCVPARTLARTRTWPCWNLQEKIEHPWTHSCPRG